MFEKRICVYCRGKAERTVNAIISDLNYHCLKCGELLYECEALPLKPKREKYMSDRKRREAEVYYP